MAEARGGDREGGGGLRGGPAAKGEEPPGTLQPHCGPLTTGETPAPGTLKTQDQRSVAATELVAPEPEAGRGGRSHERWRGLRSLTRRGHEAGTLAAAGLGPATTAEPAPLPPLMPSRVGLQGTGQIALGRQPALRSRLCGGSEGAAVGELVVDFQPVLEDNSATKAEGAPIHLSQVPTFPGRQVKAESSSGHLAKRGVAVE